MGRRGKRQVPKRAAAVLTEARTARAVAKKELKVTKFKS